jgi:DNA polymerase I-like protein with 3'-5' exonuclease and polymerase domains
LGREVIFLDLETTGIDPLFHKVVTIALLIPNEYTRLKLSIIDCRRMDLKELGSVLGPALERSLIIGQNLKFDLSFLSTQCEIKPIDVVDTMILEQILVGRGFGSGFGFSLEDIAQRRNIKISKKERNWFIDLDKRQEWYFPFPSEQIAYIGQDVRILDQLYFPMLDEIEQNNLEAAAELECKVVPCLADVESNGIQIDEEQLSNVIAEEQEKVHQLEERCIEVFGPHILLAREPLIQQYKKDLDLYKQALEEEECRLKQLWLSYQESNGGTLKLEI